MNMKELIDELIAQGIYITCVEGKLKVKAQAGAMTAQIKQQLGQNKAALLAYFDELNNENSPASSALSIPQRDQSVPAVSSFAQSRLWFIDKLEGASLQYNIPNSFKLTGTLNRSALNHALEQVVMRHHVLRTVFEEVDGRGQPKVLPAFSLPLTEHDLTGLDSTKAAAEVARLGAEDLAKPFDLSSDVMIRFSLIKLAEQQHVIMVNIHHIAFDGWSMNILLKDFMTLYGQYCQGNAAPLPQMKLQYADYSAWQQAKAEHGEFENQLVFWRNKLQSLPQLHNLPLDFRRPNVQSYQGGQYHQQLPGELTEVINSQIQHHDTTLFMYMYSAFSVLLSRLGGETDVVVGTPVSGRDNVELEQLIGCFVNNLVLRCDLSDNPSFNDILSQNKQYLIDAYDNQQLPFERLVESLKPNRDLSYNPLFQIVFRVSNDDADQAFVLPELELTPHNRELEQSKVDLEVSVVATEQGIKIHWMYDSKLFRPSSIAQFGAVFAQLLTQLSQSPKASVFALPLMSDSDERQLFELGQGATTTDQVPLCFVDSFAKSVLAHGDSIAVQQGCHSLSYKQLNEKAERLAAYLIESEIDAECRVGIYMSNSPDMMIALLGVMKSGAAYVPVDPKHPAQRVADIIEDAQIELVILDSALVDELNLSKTDVLLMDNAATDEQWLEEFSAAEADLAVEHSGEDIVYVLYTSGSTGKPKGVEIRQQGLSNYLQFAAKTYLAQDCRESVVSSPLCFDATITTLLTPLMFGGSVNLLEQNEQLLEALKAQLFNSQQAKLFKLTPAHIEAISNMAQGQSSQSQHRLIVGGEQLSVNACIHWQQKLLPKARIINEYGPTETVVGCCIFEFDNATTLDVEHLQDCPIGLPIDNTQLYVLNSQGQSVGPNAVGELYIGGNGVAKGYLGLEQQTQQRFVQSPFNEQQRLYRTGDLVRWLADDHGAVQALAFVGRCDEQVKVRGYRIELGEVEQTLSTGNGVKQAVVVTDKDRLLAYIVADSEQQTPSTQVLKRHLAERLPEYMVPDAITMIETVPLTVNGKIDRAKLLQLELDDEQHSFVAPSSQTEKQLCLLWQEILQRPSIGINERFFDIGGHSLLATKLIAGMGREFNIDVPLRAIFDHGTVGQLAEYIDQACDNASIEPIPLLSERDNQGLSYAQQSLWLVDQMAGGSAQYNMLRKYRLTGEIDLKAFEQALHSLYERHEILRSRFVRQGDEAKVNIAPVPQKPLLFSDISLFASAEKDKTITQMIDAQESKVFSLEQDELLVVQLLKLEANEYILLVNTHHIISDGVSQTIFIDEFSRLYDAYSRNTTASLSPVEVQYGDYAQWQRHRLKGDGYAQQLEYWQQQLSELPQCHELPLDRPRPQSSDYSGNYHGQTLNSDTAKALEALCARHDVTLFMLLQSVFATMVYQASGQQDIALGTPVSCRNHPSLDSTLGMFVNSVVLRNDLSGDISFAQLLERNKQMVLDGFSAEDVPFEQLVKQLDLSGNHENHPLYQLLFSLQYAQAKSVELLGLSIAPIDSDEYKVKYDLQLIVTQYQDEQGGVEKLHLNWLYANALFEPSTIARFAKTFELLVQAVLSDSQCPVNQLPLMNANAREQVLEYSQGVSVDTGQSHFIEQFEAIASSQSEHIAVLDGGKSLSYGELNQKANRLAHCLAEQEMGSGEIVGILLNSSLELMVALLAVIKSGAAYVPIDGRNGEKRIAHIIEDTGLEIIITDKQLIDQSPLAGVDVLMMDNLLDDDFLEEYPTSDLAVDIAMDDGVYVIYTSGSSGKPKGVEISHSGLLDYLSFAKTHFYDERLSQSLCAVSHSFDLSVPGLFLPLMCGGTVEQISSQSPLKGLAERLTLNSTPESLVRLTPSQVSVVLELIEPPSVSTNHCFVIGGEAFGVETAKALQQKFPNSAIYNHYGPTETVVGCSVFDVTNHIDCLGHQIPIGQPMDNTDLYVLDQAKQLCPVGVAGELYIGGTGVAKGYLNQPELNAQKFIVSPFDENQRLYRSGDMVKWDAQGNLNYLSRNDSQLKLRGFRIDAGEIHAALNQVDCVDSAVVDCIGQDNEKALAAFIQVNQQAAPIAHKLLTLNEQIQDSECQLFNLENEMTVAGINQLETEHLYQDIIAQDNYLCHGMVIPKNAIVLDAGANIGVFSLNIAQQYTDATIYAFEPVPAIYSALALNAELYGQDRIIHHCCGLSDKAGHDSFDYYPHATVFSGANVDREENVSKMMSILSNESGEQQMSSEDIEAVLQQRLTSTKVDVELSTVSAQIDHYGLTVIDLLKVDVEGAELSVLKGIEQRHWPLIAQMVIETNDQSECYPQILTLLGEQGFDYRCEKSAELGDTSLVNIYAVKQVLESAEPAQVPASQYWSVERWQQHIEQCLSKELTSYMVPSKLILLPQFKTTENGKLDYRWLYEQATEQPKVIQRAKTDVEKSLVEIWAALLNKPLEEISINESFFNLGGHSLLVIRMDNMIAKQFGVEVGINQLFNLNTVQLLAEFVETASNTLQQQQALFEAAEQLEEEEL